MTFPEIMQTPFEPPIPVKEGHGLPTIIRTPAEAYAAFDGWVPRTLIWNLIGSSLGAMRRKQMTDVVQMRWLIESALSVEDLLFRLKRPPCRGSSLD